MDPRSPLRAHTSDGLPTTAFTLETGLASSPISFFQGCDLRDVFSSDIGSLQVRPVGVAQQQLQLQQQWVAKAAIAQPPPYRQVEIHHKLLADRPRSRPGDAVGSTAAALPQGTQSARGEIEATSAAESESALFQELELAESSGSFSRGACIAIYISSHHASRTPQQLAP